MSKKYIIEKHTGFETDGPGKMILNGGKDMTVSDGYHTMDELYEHRIALFIALCQDLAGNNHPNIWKSKKHHDGSEYEGWFIMGINDEKGEQITYHLPMSEWDNTHFAKIYDFAPEWDGHTSADVIKRIKNL